jgi:hypothetical protein
MELVTAVQELWNKPTTCVRQHECLTLTHGGRAGLHGTEKESAKGMQVYSGVS